MLYCILSFTNCKMALSQRKTTLSILRATLGSVSGNAARLAKKIGRSESWITKVSCGQIPMNRDAAILISYETGVCEHWLFAGDITKPAIDKEGKPYTSESFLSHRVKNNSQIDAFDLEWSRQEFAVSIAHLLKILLASIDKNRGGVFCYYLEEFCYNMAEKFGVLEAVDKKEFIDEMVQEIYAISTSNLSSIALQKLDADLKIDQKISTKKNSRISLKRQMPRPSRPRKSSGEH